jgi:hypothetical protein
MCWHLPLLLLPLLELDADTDCDNQPNAPCSVLCLLPGRLPLYQKSILQLAIELHEFIRMRHMDVHANCATGTTG